MASETLYPVQLSQQHRTSTTPAPPYISPPAMEQYDPEKGSPTPNAVAFDGSIDKRTVALFGSKWIEELAGGH